MSFKLAFISKNIICEGSRQPLHGFILVEDGIISQILPYDKDTYDFLMEQYLVEDLGDLFISPGLIDLNVTFGYEGSSVTTKAGLCGGVTCISTTDRLDGEIYTDIAPLLQISDDKIGEIPSLLNSNIFGLKAFLVPQGPESQILTKVEEALRETNGNLPIFVHPEFTTHKELLENTPFHMVIPEERGLTPSEFKIEEFPENEFSSSSSDDEIEPFDYSPDSTPTTKDIGGIRRTSFKIPVIISPFEILPNRSPEKKRGSLPNVFSVIQNHSFSEEIKTCPNKVRGKRHSILCTLGNQNKPIPPQDFPFMKRGSISSESYKNYAKTFPESWEAEAVEKVLSLNIKAKIHFTNVCSNKAIELIRNYRDSYPNLTCETSLPYLFFSNIDVKPGDTRYKVNPPIRDGGNYNLLWDSLKLRYIDCISSYHQPVAPPQKFLGDFKRAVNGVSSMGYLLQAIWTRLKADVREDNEKSFLVLLSQWLSQTPAEILGLKSKGSISAGKDADLVIWDPYQKFIVKPNENISSEMSPLMGEELYGKIMRTYVRGKLAFNDNSGVICAVGEVLRRKNY
ncbi:allB_1 [Blepharisma stoltei]|uniref:Amidohydrolase-related domain-containing protein n=1 Tax=Blepharisma stoltei TaxID=1481888 RepID=A0AAU9IP50_9CILI|nr:unnamed protein product [Blepharisma stoltei]